MELIFYLRNTLRAMKSKMEFNYFNTVSSINKRFENEYFVIKQYTY